MACVIQLNPDNPADEQGRWVSGHGYVSALCIDDADAYPLVAAVGMDEIKLSQVDMSEGSTTSYADIILTLSNPAVHPI